MLEPTPETAEPQFRVRVAAKRPLAEGIVGLTLVAADGEALPPWTPGAHVDLLLGEDIVRQYSLCGELSDSQSLSVAVLREREGRGGSAFVHDRLAVGDLLTLRGPRNHFPLLDARRYLFIAGGIGITPLAPMIAQLDAAAADWQLVYGGRSRASMAFREELVDRYGDRVSILPQDEVGLLDLRTLLGRPGASAEDLRVYCCGPEGLLEAVEAACADWPLGALQLERFAPRPDTFAAPQEAFEVELANSGTVLSVPPGRSILSVLEDAGLPVLSSCREGTCGTCETGVLAGAIDHRDSVLDAAEREAGDVMMICVSRARGGRLVLDL